MAQGRSTFTRSELERIRLLIREKQTADRDRQKALRARLRSMGFRISDFAEYQGFVESDLDDLIARGTINVTEENGVRARADAPSEQTGSATPQESAVGESERLENLVAEASSCLGQKAPLAKAEHEVPRRPGLYAIHGAAKTWRELGLGDPPDPRPLYIGKAENSLVSRDLGTHFRNGRTGSSTVRRSFAALLRELLELSACPRNPRKAERFANYGLPPEHDERLTTWMRENLELGVWPKPERCDLGQIEVLLLARFQPPLNLQNLTTPWTSDLKAARAVMANEARAWADRTER